MSELINGLEVTKTGYHSLVVTNPDKGETLSLHREDLEDLLDTLPEED